MAVSEFFLAVPAWAGLILSTGLMPDKLPDEAEGEDLESETSEDEALEVTGQDGDSSSDAESEDGDEAGFGEDIDDDLNADGSDLELGQDKDSKEGAPITRRSEMRRVRLRGRERGDLKEAGDGGTEDADDGPDAGSTFQDSRRIPETVDELLGETLRLRAQSADPKLRTQLTGSILVRFVNSGKRFLFDWSQDPLTMGATDRQDADCVIALSEATLLRIATGDLNPQIAMLSDKIEVKGALALAIYWFNLIAPRGMAHGHGAERGA